MFSSYLLQSSFICLSNPVIPSYNIPENKIRDTVIIVRLSSFLKSNSPP